MRLKIHRGSKEIGGSCVEISTGKARILLDFGLPLTGSEKSMELLQQNSDELVNKKILPDIKGLYGNGECEISAIFISHAHPDHFGLLKYINPNIPVYMSEVSCSIIKEISPILYGINYGFDNIKIIDNNEIVQIQDISIKPYPMDHSIPSSYAFEITADNETLLYTGDFRVHGRTGYNLDRLINSVKGKIDYLMLEGTTIGREKTECLTEFEIENKLYGEFSQNKLNIIVFSAQNLDRFISVYKACLRNKKTLVIDPYTAFILEKFQCLSKNIPQYDWNNVKIYFAPNRITEKLAETGELYKYKGKKISIEEILNNPESFVVKDNYIITGKILEHKGIEGIQAIYSLWEGYLEKEDNFWHPYKNKLKHIHTSGHAYPQDLKDFVNAVNPKKIIPIHTSFPESYHEIFGDKVVIINDREEYANI
ncbi:MAG TPA: MBL fold metallo-hydrolase [Candidatus Gastranaerophilales bacterium]|nr:MBL fold metallo-hydrolase [Candidatus Gastranaerophilales bacterium]